MRNERAEQFQRLLVSVFVLSIMLALSTLGQEINGPDRFDAYRLCEFEAVGEPTWSYSWAFYPRGKIDYRESEFGLKTTFTGPPGQYEAELLVTGPTGDMARPFFIRRVIKAFSIGTPPPGPGPSPGPDVIPPGRFGGVPKFCVDQLTAASLDKETARAIAANFGDVVKESREGRYLNLQAAITAVKERNKATLERAGKYAAWKPVLDRIGARLGQSIKDTAPMADLIEAFAEVQIGMLWYAEH